MKDFINIKINLNSFIDYAKDSVVSKTFYKSERVILTIFALDKGQNIAEHITPFDAFVQVIDGEAELIIGSEKKLLKTGESIIMPANIPHALFARNEYKMLLTMMK